MHPERLVGYPVLLGESDLMVYTETDLYPLALSWLRIYRQQIIDYIRLDRRFLTSLSPIAVDQQAPAIIRAMASAAASLGVGPMAAVAGAIAQYVGTELAKRSSEVIVENGGDIYLFGHTLRNVLIYAGKSPFSERLSIRLYLDGPLSICTSAGTFGHSLSFGRADAAVAISQDALLADAAATAIGNLTKSGADIQAALDLASRTQGILGSLVIVGDRLGVWGEVELTSP